MSDHLNLVEVKSEYISREIARNINPLIGTTDAEHTMALVSAALAFFEDIQDDDNSTHIEHYDWGRSLLLSACRKALDYETQRGKVR